MLRHKMDQVSALTQNYSCCMQGAIPLHCAAQHDHMEITQLLLQHGSDVNCQDNNVSLVVNLAELLCPCHRCTRPFLPVNGCQAPLLYGLDLIFTGPV